MLSVDDLILDLLATGRQATAEELTTLVAHVAQAPFATYLSRIPAKLRGLLAQRGVTVPAKLPSCDIHLLKRIHDEQQWPIGTTTEQYVADLHHAISQPQVHVWTYQYFGQPFVGFLAPSHVQGAGRPEAFIFVAYGPVYGTITTGYQASRADQVFIYGCTELVRHQ